jgi:hypothetical protein
MLPVMLLPFLDYILDRFGQQSQFIHRSTQVYRNSNGYPRRFTPALGAVSAPFAK